MSKITSKKIQFPALKNHKITFDFSGDHISSDAGGLLLRESDRKLNLLAPIAKLFSDNRDSSKIIHSIETMLRQRVFGIALGYDDLNDHNTLRNDVAFQTIVSSNNELASSPTLCRFENTANREIAVGINKLMIENFIASFKEAPEELILDFDATENPIYGEQEGKYYNGFYRSNCFLPLHIYCGKQILISYLRTSKKDGAHHSWAILSLLVKRFRQVWPNVKIIFRADCGFYRHKTLSWCERNNVDYIVGAVGNPRLLTLLKPQINRVKRNFEETKIKQREFARFMYAAETWTTERYVIGKAEHNENGSNQRFVVTTLNWEAPGALSDDSQELYDSIYCARGDMENRIKDSKLDVASGRTSCHDWWPNQLRVLLSALAYILIDYIRRCCLTETELASAQMGTIRLKLFKIGAVITKTAKRTHFQLSRYFPLQIVFIRAFEILFSG